MKTPLKVFSHNILRSIVGYDQHGTPQIQPAILAAGNCEVPFESLIRKYSASIGHPNSAELAVPRLLADIQAEFLTLKEVLNHCAYFNTPFPYTSFADAITHPAAWLGQSIYRVHRLVTVIIQPANIPQVSATINVVAAMEAMDAWTCLENTALGLSDILLVDEDIYNHNAGEDTHDTI